MDPFLATVLIEAQPLLRQYPLLVWVAWCIRMESWRTVTSSCKLPPRSDYYYKTEWFLGFYEMVKHSLLGGRPPPRGYTWTIRPPPKSTSESSMPCSLIWLKCLAIPIQRHSIHGLIQRIRLGSLEGCQHRSAASRWPHQVRSEINRIHFRRNRI